MCEDEEDAITEIIENMKKVEKYNENFKEADQHQLKEETSEKR